MSVGSPATKKEEGVFQVSCLADVFSTGNPTRAWCGDLGNVIACRSGVIGKSQGPFPIDWQRVSVLSSEKFDR